MKRVILFLLFATFFLILSLFCNSAYADNSFIVLNYPKISLKKTHTCICKKDFIKQMQYLKDNGFTVIGIDDLNAMFYQGKSIPGKSVLLIFSGGQRQTYEIVNPIIKKLNFKAVFILNLKNMEERNTHYVSWHDMLVMSNAKHWDLGILAKDNCELNQQLKFFSKKFKNISLKTVIADTRIDKSIIKDNFKIAFKLMPSYAYNNRDTDPLCLGYINIRRLNNLKIMGILARVHFDNKQYYEAEVLYRKLIKESPGDANYMIGLANCLYRRGKYKEALLIADHILENNSNNLSALKFKANDYFYRQNLVAAKDMFERIYHLIPDNMSIINKLISINFELKDYDKVIELAKRSISIDSSQIAVLLLYADALRFKQRFYESKKQYERIIIMNPNNLSAKSGLMHLYIESKQYKKAININDQLIAIDRANIDYQITRARILAYQFKYNEAEDILIRLNKKYSQEGNFLILLYHGLSDVERSDILKVKDFREQLMALRDAGYESISLSDLNNAYQGKMKLPKKGVLITFDDARRDSFEYATPILKELNFKAVMFVPVSCLGSNDEFFVSKNDLVSYQNSGIWEIQSHGDFAHQDIVIDNKGHKSLFLANKKWLEDRFESSEEFRLRIEKDYLESKQKLQQILNNNIYAYAFPQGSFGQLDFSNFNQAPENNLEFVKKYYFFSFIQDNSGFNFTSDDPCLLKRFKIGFDLKIEEFKKHITESSQVKIQMLLKDVERWKGGNKKIELRPCISYFDDSSNRSNIKLSNYFTIRPYYNFSFTPFYSKVYLEEKGAGKIHENEYGLGLIYKNGVNSCSAEILYKDYSCEYNKVNYSLGYKTKFAFLDYLIINTSLKNIERLKAVRAKTTAYENFIALNSNLPLDFALYGKYQYSDYNDKNQRHSARMSLSHLIWPMPHTYVAYEYIYDDAKIDSDNYYSPQQLKMNNFRFRLADSFFNKKLYCDLSYILGYGKEKISKNRLTNSFAGSIGYKIKDDLDASLTYNISKTPTYRSSTALGQLRYSF
ncbi:MAG: tetratricopeptide repeat protein [Candidatus Omnitrophota bacterium]